MAESTNHNKDSAMVAVATSTPSTIHYVSELERLRIMRDFYKKGMQQTYDENICTRLEQDRQQMMQQADDAKRLLEYGGTLLDKMDERRLTTENALSSTVQTAKKMTKLLSQTNQRQEMLKMEESMQTVLNKMKQNM